MTRLIIATHNPGKLQEFRALLHESPYEISALADHGGPEPDETGLTFLENALIKARAASAHCDAMALADDSGLVVDALGGAPGVLSARFAGMNASSHDNRTALLDALKNTPQQQRTARFICVLCFVRSPNDPDPIICRGVWEGRILTEPVGTQGFGYDPLFYVPEKNCSAAQLTPEIKNALSHRAQAMQQFLKIMREGT